MKVRGKGYALVEGGGEFDCWECHFGGSKAKLSLKHSSTSPGQTKGTRTLGSRTSDRECRSEIFRGSAGSEIS